MTIAYDVNKAWTTRQNALRNEIVTSFKMAPKRWTMERKNTGQLSLACTGHLRDNRQPRRLGSVLPSSNAITWRQFGDFFFSEQSYLGIHEILSFWSHTAVMSTFSSRARIIFVLLFLCNNVCAYSASLRDGSSVCSIADFTKNVQLLLQLIHRRQVKFCVNLRMISPSTLPLAGSSCS